MIGGNASAILQVKSNSKNAFGEINKSWSDYQNLVGFLDFVGGDSSYKSNFKGDIEETTHIFLCDYVELSVETTQCRMVIDNKTYDVLLIDDPMNLHEHLEIMLKYNGVIK